MITQMVQHTFLITKLKFGLLHLILICEELTIGLRNVISHEFTHMVQIQAAMKIGRTIPAFYLQFLNYEDKRQT